MNTEEAKNIIEAERQNRARECLAKIEATCKEMNCKLDTLVIIQNGQIQTQVQVTAL